MPELVISYETVVDSLLLLGEYFGTEWLRGNSEGALDMQNNHPLIEWYLTYPSWKAACEKRGEIIPDYSIARLTILAQMLQKLKGNKKFDTLINRLKIHSMFHSTAFEIDVAARYTAKNYYVEFVEEAEVATPDLYVDDKKGTAFWVECKYRDLINEEDKQTEAHWNQLERRLMDYLATQHLNYQIVISTQKKLLPKDVSNLYKLITQAIEKDFEPKFLTRVVGASKTFHDASGNFTVAIYKLAERDIILDGNNFRLPFPHSEGVYGRFFCQRPNLSYGRSMIRNPQAVHFCPVADRVQTIKHSFKSAIKQLPECGPGIIHIRLPINSWATDLKTTEANVKDFLRKELCGNNNRRVNAVIVSIDHAKLVNKGVFHFPMRESFELTAEHTNPRSNFSQPISDFI